MRYAIPTAMLLLAILFTGVAAYNWAHAHAVRSSAVSSIAELRGQENMERCQEAERYVSTQLRQLIEGQRVPLALGALAVVTSLAALVVEAKRKQKA